MPSQPGFLPRRKLPALAGLPVEDAVPLTVLEAPFGYGKTELIDQWKEDLPLTIPVLDIDAEQQDWLGQLGAWVDGLESPALAIIDDYHSVSTATSDWELVRLLQSNPNAHLVISGRKSMLLDTPAVTGRLDTRILRASDLALTEEEVERWADRLGVDKDDRAWRVLRAANGWPLFVFEALQTASEGEPAGELLRLVAERLESSERTRRIVRLLMLTKGTLASVVREATGFSREDVRATLGGLVESGLVSMGWGAGNPRYVPHPLLSSVFPGKDDGPAGDEQELLDLAITLEAKVNAQVDPVESLRKVLERGLTAAAQEVARTHFLQLVREVEEVWPLVQEITLEDQFQAPALGGLRLYIGYTDQKTSRETLRSWAADLKIVVAKLQEKRGEADLESAVLRLAADRVLGEWSSAVRSAKALEEELQRLPRRSGGGKWTLVPLMYEAIGFTGLLGGDLELAERVVLHGLSISRAENSPVTVDALNALALINTIKARMTVAGQYLEEAVREKQKFGPKQTRNSEANAAVARAAILLGQGKLDDAAAELQLHGQDADRIDAWEQHATLEAWVNRYRLGNRKALLTLRGRIKDAGTRRMSPASASRLTAEVANLLMYEGEHAPAKQLLALPLEETPPLSLAKARLALISGDPSRAFKFAEESGRSGDPSEDLVATLLAAIALDADGDRAGGLAELAKQDWNRPVPSLQLVLSVVPYEPLCELAEALQSEDGSWLLHVAEEMPDSHKFRGSTPLTEAEMKVLLATSNRGTVKDTASHLNISANTVKSHLRAIYRKLGVSTRDQMVQAAKARGVL